MAQRPARIVFRSQAISGKFWRKIAVKPGKTMKSPDMMKAGPARRVNFRRANWF